MVPQDIELGSFNLTKKILKTRPHLVTFSSKMFCYTFRRVVCTCSLALSFYCVRTKDQGDLEHRK